jgi:hypothetical protein
MERVYEPIIGSTTSLAETVRSFLPCIQERLSDGPYRGSRAKRATKDYTFRIGSVRRALVSVLKVSGLVLVPPLDAI